MFTKILIANRGEIACRIIKTARRMGIPTVAIYSTADSESLHVSLADSAFCVGQPASIDSYLNIDAIIKVAIESGAEAIHPGYGFLSENANFARACDRAKIVFIGPSVSAMEAMSSKQLAKQRLEKTNVPLTPGYHGDDQSDERLIKEAQCIGLPVLIKAASGGGGKGMREVHSLSDFHPALLSARREAKASFDDDTMLIEKLIKSPRHIEIQIMADNHDHVVHIFERDCSIQRRHQKIIEEAPAIELSPTLRNKLTDSAIAVARAIEYRGAGTVEFLVDGDNHYFMEMNTRLQVEHPVTEMITGLDLVELQIRIAANEHMLLQQSDIKALGHAIECRICAEDPNNNFLPSIGQLHFLKEPFGNYIRVETGITVNSKISHYYDPMIAKLIAWGETREQAINRLKNALQNYHVGGVKTNIPFIQTILNNSNFINNNININFLSEQSLTLPIPDTMLALFAATSIDYLRNTSHLDPLYQDTCAWLMHLNNQWSMRYFIFNECFDVLVKPINRNEVELTILPNGKPIKLKVKDTNDKLTLDDGHQIHELFFENRDDKLSIYTHTGLVDVTRFQWQESEGLQQENQLTAPMPGMIIAILKQKGDHILAGDAIMVLEAMKMEHTIKAPKDGTIGNIYYDVGSQVSEGAMLAALEEI